MTRILSQIMNWPTALKNWPLKGSIVLLYHRVTQTDFDPNLLCVSPHNFEDQIIFLKNNYYLYSYSEFIDDLKHQELKNNGILITFDDGFADNFLEAWPILQKHQVPALIFACGLGQKQTQLWIQQLEEFFSPPNNFPPQFSIKFKNRQINFPLSNHHKTNKSHLDLQNFLKMLSPSDQQKILNQLKKLATHSVQKKNSDKRYLLTSSQFKKITQSDLITIGSHTLHHPHLASQTQNIQRQEIVEHGRDLAKIIGQEIKSFAYPFGGPKDYNQDSVDIAKNSFESAFSNFPGLCNNHTDQFQIPRFIVRNWSQNKFKSEIKKFFTWGIR